jgi:3-hydroxyacyl-CoA dehydrogenase
MPREIRKVAVLGAGVMGAGISAHLANAGISVLMLDIVPPKVGDDDAARGLTESDPKFRNKFALAGLENVKKSKPALLYSKRFLPLIEIGNFEDDWQRLAECDWIIEVVVERLDIKQKVFARVEEVRRPGTIVSSNTSGLSIAGMTEGRSDDFVEHFLVTHFFNPVRYMRLLELVAGERTSPEVVDFIAEFGRFRLGKGIVYGKDTPNFIGNRIGGFGIAATMRAMMDMDYQVDEVDAITGPAIGHPSSASFGTVDLVGLDVLAHVINTLKEGCPDDEQRDLFELPEFMHAMIKDGALGRKAKAPPRSPARTRSCSRDATSWVFLALPSDGMS